MPNVMGVTPLMAAAGLGMEPSPRFNPDAADVQDRSIATLEMLLAEGADVNARITDVKSRTARMGRGSTLQERGGQSALFGAVQWAWPRVVQYLIDHGAKVDIKDDRRRVAAGRGFGAGRQRRQSALRRGRQDPPDVNRQVERSARAGCARIRSRRGRSCLLFARTIWTMAMMSCVNGAPDVGWMPILKCLCGWLPHCKG